ncbi:hypothetical protein BGZ83_007250, partial [Gryganskiella cystojenkinii]
MNSNTYEARKVSRGSSRPDEDSVMDSMDGFTLPGATVMRVVAVRDDGSEFRIADDKYGGGSKPQHLNSKAPVKAVATDGTEFALPLDKVVVQEIVSGRKDEEPVNHLHQHLGHRVHVGIDRPSLTVFSSMGGRRNSSTTVLEFGGSSDAHAKAHANQPKEFVYRDEDFQPLVSSHPKKSTQSGSCAQGVSSQHGSHGIQAQVKHLGSSMHGGSSSQAQTKSHDSSSFGLNPSFFTQSRSHHDSSHGTTASGHHAIAYPDSREHFKIPHHHHEHDPTDHHDHHGHQCDDEDCSDHDYSHEHHLQHGGISHGAHQHQHHQHAPSSMKHQTHARVQYGHGHGQGHHTSGIATPEMHLDQLFKEPSSLPSRSGQRLHSHHLDAFNAPVHLIHAVHEQHPKGLSSQSRASASHQPSRREDPHGHHTHAVPDMKEQHKIPHHHHDHDPADHHDHHRHQCDDEDCSDHEESHEHFHPARYSSHPQYYQPPVHHRYAAVQATHAHGRDQSPELNLGTLFPDTTSYGSSKKSRQQGPSYQHHIDPFNAPAHLIHLSGAYHPQALHRDHHDYDHEQEQEHLGRSVGHMGHKPTHQFDRYVGPEHSDHGPYSHRHVAIHAARADVQHHQQQLKHQHAPVHKSHVAVHTHHSHAREESPEWNLGTLFQDTSSSGTFRGKKSQSQQPSWSQHRHVEAFNAPAHLIHPVAHHIGASSSSSSYHPSHGTSHAKTDDEHSWSVVTGKKRRSSGKSASAATHVPSHTSSQEHQGQALKGHAHAAPAHNIHKILHHHRDQEAGDHHDHHRHQCDDEECSDHDDSHQHQYQHAGYGSHSSHQQHHASSSIKHQAHAKLQTSHGHHSTGTSTPEMHLDQLFKESSTSGKSSKSHKTNSTSAHGHHVEPFNAPAHLIHSTHAHQYTDDGHGWQTQGKRRKSNSQPAKTAHRPTAVMHSHDHARTASPELNLGVLFNENQVMSGVASKKSKNKLTQPHHVDPFNAPAHLIHPGSHHVSAAQGLKSHATYAKVAVAPAKQSSGHGKSHLQPHAQPSHIPVHKSRQAPHSKPGPSHHAKGSTASAHSHPAKDFPELHLEVLFKEQHARSGQYSDHHQTGDLEQQHLEEHLINKRRGNSHGHHAIAVPAHNAQHKIKHAAVETEPWDHHNHHRHQCDDEHCGDHNQSHRHFHPEGYKSPYPKPVVAPVHQRHVVVKSAHGRHARDESPELNLGALFKEPVSSGSKKSSASKTKSSSASKSRFSHHHIDPFNAPAHLIHATGIYHPQASHHSDYYHEYEHMGRSVGHKGHKPTHQFDGYVDSEYSDNEPSHHQHQVTAHAAYPKTQYQQQQHTPVHKSHSAVHAHHSHARNESPELNLGTLFQEVSYAGSSAQGRKYKQVPSSHHHVDPFNAPVHLIHPAAMYHPHAPYSRLHYAPVKQFHTNVHAHHARPRNDSPEYNLGTLFAEKQSQYQPTPSRQAPVQFDESDEHKDRSVGHKGHKPAHSLRPVDKHWNYDTEIRESDDPNSHHHQHSDHEPMIYIAQSSSSRPAHASNHHTSATPKATQQHHQAALSAEHDHNHQSYKHQPQQMYSGRVSPYYSSQSQRFVGMHHHSSHARTDSPEMNLGQLFREDGQSRWVPHKPAPQHFVSGSYTYSAAVKNDHHGNPVSKLPSSSSRRYPSHHEEAPHIRHSAVRAQHTRVSAASPELNLGKLFEIPSQSRPSKHQHFEPLEDEDEKHKQEHLQNRARGNSHGHHAHATPDMKDQHKTIHQHYDHDPADHHDHHRHQCDDDDCSDHEESHEHFHPARYSSHPQYYQPPVHHRYAAVQATHAHGRDQSPELNLGTLFPDTTSYGSSKKSRQQVPSYHHHVDPFNAPAHLIHPADTYHPQAPHRDHHDYDYEHEHMGRSVGHKGHRPTHQFDHYGVHTPVHKSHTAVHGQHLNRRDQTPDMNLGSLFQETDASYGKSQRSAAPWSQHHHVDPFNAPVHLIHSAGTYRAQAPSASRSHQVPVNQFHATVHAHHSRPRNDSPEYNLGSLFAENQSRSNRHAPLHSEHTDNSLEHKDRSIGHHGHKPAHALRPTGKHWDYDIEMRESDDPHAHHHPEHDHQQGYDAKGRPYLLGADDYDDFQYHAPAQQHNTGSSYDHQVDKHTLNQQRGNSHGYHAIAYPDSQHHFKVSHLHHDHDSTDHHNHHRHQCDDEYCSDHEESHAHHGHPTHTSLPSSYGRSGGAAGQGFGSFLADHTAEIVDLNDAHLNIGAFYGEAPDFHHQRKTHSTGGSHLGSMSYAEAVKHASHHHAYNPVTSWSSHAPRQRHPPTHPRRPVVRAAHHHHTASSSPNLNLGTLFPESRSGGDIGY